MTAPNEQLELFSHPRLKRCSWCGQRKSPSEFHRNATKPDGLNSRCKVCNIAGAKRYHAENTEHCRARISSWARRVNYENKRRVLEYLQVHPCVDCGEADPIVLEFDHQRDKTNGVAELLHTHVRWEVVAAEIEKCEVRCANCHRRRTAIQGGWFRVVENLWAARDSNAEPTN